MITLFNLALGLCISALLVSAVGLFVKRRAIEIVASVLLAAGAAVLTAYIGLRWHAAMRAPFSNMFESLVLFAWAIVVVYLVLRIRVRIPVLGSATALIAAITLAYASTFESDIRPLMPALQSNWLFFHVFTCFWGYAGFAVSSVAAVCYLIVSRQNSDATEASRQALETIVSRTIAFGFLFLTVGIITGSVWANSAWGTYWSWDPKETWSLITWFIYAIFLHCRFMRGWRGERAAWISIIGFASVLFTYFGVNFILSGLHSYASP